MSLFRRQRRRLTELDARVADAADANARAAAEARKSEERYEAVQKHVVQPLRQAAEENQFASLIRMTLVNGNGNGGKS